VKPVELEGFWWDAATPETQVAGRLVYSVDDVHLQLIGALSQSWAFLSGKPEEYPLLLGITTDNKEVSLVECVAVAAHFGSGAPSQRIVPRTVLVGAHIPDAKNQTWERVFVSFAHLGDWLAHESIESEPEVDDNGLAGFSIKYKRPEPLKANLPGVSIGLEVFLETVPTAGTGQAMTPQAMFRVALDEPETLGQIMKKYVVPLQDLLTLATGRTCTTTSMTLLTPDLVAAGGGYELPVEALFRSPRVGIDDDERIHPWDMLFTAHVVKDEFQDFMSRWMKLASEVEAVRSLLFGAQYVSGGLENKFLNAAQAAEVFHRLTFKGQELPKAKHKERMKTVLDAVPAALRVWVKDKLAYSNELTLRERFDQLFEYVAPSLDEIVANPEGFSKKVRKQRNDLTHRGRVEDASDQGLEELFLLTSAMEVLVQAALLRRLGFEPKLVAQCVERGHSYITVAANGGIK
jgi:hypothetical protein